MIFCQDFLTNNIVFHDFSNFVCKKTCICSCLRFNHNLNVSTLTETLFLFPEIPLTMLFRNFLLRSQSIHIISLFWDLSILFKRHKPLIRCLAVWRADLCLDIPVFSRMKANLTSTMFHSIYSIGDFNSIFWTSFSVSPLRVPEKWLNAPWL